MKLLKEFNQYLANLAILTVKLHNIHWNVEGLQFVQIHEFTEMEYDKAFARMDAVAEHIKMFDQLPLSTVTEFVAAATIKEEPTRKFSCVEALEIVLQDLSALRKEATELRHACDDEGCFSGVALFEEHVADYNKQIWFIKSMLA